MAVAPSITVDRYTLYGELASGGMGTVHFAKMKAEGGARPVAVKRLHPHLRNEEAFAMMLLDEARLAMSVRHRNVVEVLDVVSTHEELLLVMEYVPGLSLAELFKLSRYERVPVEVAVRIAVDVLHGLHAAHEAKSDEGQPLGLVHRDVSPHNLLVGSAGLTKLTDFGVAKAVGRLRSTKDGGIKGKIAYMSPEQVAGGTLDPRSDIYGAAVVLWEMLAGRPMFEAESDVALFGMAMRGANQRLAQVVPDVPHALDAAIWRALARDPRRRYPTALAFAETLSEAGFAGTARDVTQWMTSWGKPLLEEREQIVTTIVQLTSEPTLTITEINPASSAPIEPDTLPFGNDIDIDAYAPTVSAASTSPSASASVSVARRRTPEKPSTKARAVAMGFGALLALGAGLFFLRTPQKEPELTPTTTTTPDSVVVPIPVTAAAPPTVMPTTTTAATTTAEPPRPAASGPRKAAVNPVNRRHDSTPAATPKPADSKGDCNPPYTVDEQGGKHFKAWCFK